jgi:hypothetical protein
MNINGFTFEDGDIVAYNLAENRWTMVFDGSDVGIVSDMRDFTVTPDGAILFTLHNEQVLPDVGLVDDSDVVMFMPAQLGEETAGIFSLFLDGSDISLSAASEDIDALHLLEDGRLVFSTIGNVRDENGTLIGRQEDIFILNHTSLGENTAGTISRFVDGSDIGLTGDSEDVKTFYLLPEDNKMFFSVVSNFDTGTIAGNSTDIFSCIYTSLGIATRCNYSTLLDLNGNSIGLNNGYIDGFWVNW